MTVHTTVRVPCPTCNTAGEEPDPELGRPRVCHECHGNRWLIENKRDVPWPTPNPEPEVPNGPTE